MTPIKRNYLLPGAYIVTAEPMLVSTILGSCVAVALTDPKTKISGLCHYLLSRLGDATGPIARYGDQAIPILVDEMVGLGANPRSIIAKIYGGANVLGNVSIGLEVGKKNISIARELLGSMKIPIVKEDIGGDRGRKLLMTTDTFDIQQTFMEKSGSPASANPRPVASSLKALVIDPTPRASRIHFEKILAQAGITVIETVPDAFDAFRTVTNNKPDLVIFGLSNQSKSELQVIKDLKKMTPLPPFFIYSLGGTGINATQALELGARDFVHGESAFDLEAIKALATLLAEKIRESSQARKI